MDHDEEIAKVLKEGFEMVEKFGIDTKEDDFVFVQEYDEGQAIVITFEKNEESKRGVKVIVNDTTFVLPKKEGKFLIFGNSEDE